MEHSLHIDGSAPSRTSTAAAVSESEFFFSAFGYLYVELRGLGLILVRTVSYHGIVGYVSAYVVDSAAVRNVQAATIHTDIADAGVNIPGYYTDQRTGRTALYVSSRQIKI